MAALAIAAVVLGREQRVDEPAPGQRLEVLIPTRDGGRLRTLIAFPSQPKPPGGFPTVLERTPYDVGSVDVGGYLAEGYVAVIQNLRGFPLPASPSPVFLREAEDGSDTLEWLARQSWSNGKFATVGAGLGGFAQYALAGARSPHHVGMVAQFAPASLYDAVYQGGVFKYYEWHRWLKRHAPGSLSAFLEHYRYDDFWRPLDSRTGQLGANVPALHVTGWFDQYRDATIDSFVRMQGNGQPGSHGRQKLLIGPWSRSTVGRRRQGDLVFPAAAQMNLRESALLSLRSWLKGGAAHDAPAIRYYVMGDVDDPAAPGNEWRESDRWPVPGSATRFYLRAGGSLSPSPPEESDSHASYTHRLPPPLSRGGGRELEEPIDQREPKSGVLTYQTAPLTEPVEVTGPMTVFLWASTDAVDTDFAAKLTDVYPDGRSMLLSDGIIRTRFRNRTDAEDFAVPGVPQEYSISLSPTSYVFNRAHRIRLVVASSHFPRFEANPNNGRPHWFFGQASSPAANIVYHDRERPSSIQVTVISGSGATREKR